MFEDERQFGSSPGIADRRAHPRIQARSLAYIELDQNNGGLILNISEDGLAVQSVQILEGLVFPKMRFRLPKSPDWIEASGKLVWEGISHKEAGIVFVNLSEAARQKIQDWIYSARSDLSGPVEDGHFKIVWESEERIDVPGRSLPGEVSPEFDSMFPSEKSLPAVPPQPNKSSVAGLNSGAPKASRNRLVANEATSPLHMYDLPIVEPVPSETPMRKSSKPGSSADRLGPSNATSENHEAAQFDSDGARAADDPGPIASAEQASPHQRRAEPKLNIVAGQAFYDELMATHAATLSAHNLRAALNSTQPPVRNSATQSSTGSSISFTGFGYQPSAFEEHRGRGWIAVAAILLAILATGVVMAIGPANVKSLVFRSKASDRPQLAVQGPPPPSGAAAEEFKPPVETPQSASAPLATDSIPPSQAVEGAANATGAKTTEPPRQGLTAQDPLEMTEPDDKLETPEEAEAKVRAFQLEHSVRGGAGSTPLEPAQRNEINTSSAVQPAAQQPIVIPSVPPSPPPPSQNARTLDAYPQSLESSKAPQQTETGFRPFTPAPGTVAISSHFHGINGTDFPPPGSLQIGQLVSFHSPAYPVEAARAHVEGTVVLRVVVDQIGKVQSVQVVSGSPMLIPAAINAVREWRYGQTILNNRAVESQDDITVAFRLSNTASSPR